MSEQVMFTTGAVALSHQTWRRAEAPSRSPLLPGHDENVVEEEEVDVMPGRPLEEDAAVFHVGGQLPPLDHPPGGRHQREGLGGGGIGKTQARACACTDGKYEDPIWGYSCFPYYCGARAAVETCASSA